MTGFPLALADRDEHEEEEKENLATRLDDRCFDEPDQQALRSRKNDAEPVRQDRQEGMMPKILRA
ncbi:MAG: hypothetical protein HGB06_02075 [Chlorobaculum sp.]|nr:hypothetical protein [Chlorobaculum sp.]